tara:strand:- start:290 stop:1459 length:1170 start_codon:yes stop_codon:yes gene_type:complete
MSLNVTVTPGHTFTDSETVTTGKLNAASTPTVSVSGSIDSSELGAGSVDTTQLAAKAVVPAKMGESETSAPSTSPFTMKQDADDSTSETTYQKKGNIYVSGAGGATDGQYQELFAGTPNHFLVGHAKKVEDTWTGDWTLRSKELNSASDVLLDQQDNDTITLKIGQYAVVRNNLASDCVGSSNISNYSITLDKLTPGGGASTGAAGGPIAELDDTFWGGLIDFNPKNDAGFTEYHGKAETIQPTAKHQVVYSVAEKEKLAFGHHPCIPKAWVNALQTGGVFGRTSTDATYTTQGDSGIDSITTTEKGVIEIVFDSSTAIAVGDTVRVFGFGKPWVNTAFSVFPHAAAVAVASGSDVKLEVKFYHKSGNTDPWVDSTTLDTPSWFNLMFF